ncbi:tetratricopeptide (TPR) repeat protein [Chryseobacterium sp. SORGH_AS 447]|uniref:tetratricopeptide repeat protein n=1 Tax=Chryseobacterium sp. SORGH_AS_0447 TaxID=3041769 RepID=UPI0027833F3A|nr:tetratricopeptide repeat protein [Chryseobacterium sp. SORGH_AS_0447]MDQ1162390.1 tetratricopeptide (TPR) repeat protein [Chryseobacterium sp. SORGH_AS_0447]
MKEILHQKAWEALNAGNYALAAKNWVYGYALPDSRTELKKMFRQITAINEEAPHPDLYAILGLIALDYNEIFEPNRENALAKCLDWSIAGAEIDPKHYHCNRNAGSALYWLNDWKGALGYYEISNQIRNSPVLQIRIFNIRHINLDHQDFSEFKISTETDSGMEAYNAGVEINRILDQFPQMADMEKQHLIQLKTQLYERSYLLYKNAIEGNGDELNHDPHTFAMCCNNLARELSIRGDYGGAIAIATEGIMQSRFMFILLNRMDSYSHAQMPEKAIADAQVLLEEYSHQMDFITLISVIDCLAFSYSDLKRYEEALYWADEGLKHYYEIDPADTILQHEDVTRCVTNFFIFKAKASVALGLETDTTNDAVEADYLLESMPDNPSLMISRADAFMKEGNWQKALDCYNQAIHFGVEQNKHRSVQVAFYNQGYILEVHLKNSTAALESFEQSMHYGNRDFWCFYWAVHTAYHLLENEKTVNYGTWALSVMPGQGGVTDDITAEIYEHIGSAQLDLGNYDEAVKYLEQSLQLNDLPHTRTNLNKARSHINKKGGFFRNFFGK